MPPNQCNSYSDDLEAPAESSGSFHIWFQVDCVVEAALPNKRVSISCPTFSSTTTLLDITNPHLHGLKLKVCPVDTSAGGEEQCYSV